MKTLDQRRFNAMADGSVGNRVVVVFYNETTEEFIGFSTHYLAVEGVPVDPESGDPLVYNSTQLIQ